MADNKLVYSILKSYKGIFRKTHAGNTQMIFVPLEDRFIGLIILGEIEGRDNVWAAHQFLSAGLEWMNPVLVELNEDENFEIIETVPIKLKAINKGWEYKITIPKKEKWMADFKLSFAPEYSQGDTVIFLLDGKLTFVFTDDVKPDVLKMSSLKQMSKVKSVLGQKSLKMSKFIK